MDLAFKTLLDFGNLMFEKNLLNWVRGRASLLERALSMALRTEANSGQSLVELLILNLELERD